MDPDTIRPRNWSNRELEKFAPFLDGRVLNVSGWRDEDKEGRHYRDYFSRAKDYSISNYRGERGATGSQGELLLDLEGVIPGELANQFQVAFNHTVLEHVFDIHAAIKNICALSSDIVILVTPLLQHVHCEAGSYGDYWRPTPMCLQKILASHGFQTVYQSANDNRWYVVYVFTVAMKEPARHPDLPRAQLGMDTGIQHFLG